LRINLQAWALSVVYQTEVWAFNIQQSNSDWMQQRLIAMAQG
jgi:hypothetical protein